jgi:hypothetical protein
VLCITTSWTLSREGLHLRHESVLSKYSSVE